ncbi:hypothetical protein [Zhongshania sp.]|uniref:hypothetical protein n=1 Tax=Zhongshania sp. TaxID=1971902 RepID=UPI0035681202
MMTEREMMWEKIRMEWHDAVRDKIGSNNLDAWRKGYITLDDVLTIDEVGQLGDVFNDIVHKYRSNNAAYNMTK